MRARERRRNRTVSRSLGGADLQSELQAAPISSPMIAAKIAISRSTARSREASIAIVPSRDHAVDRDLAFDRDRDQRRDLAKCRSRSRLRDIAPSRDCAVDREIAPSRDCAVDREIAIVDDIFLGFVFSFFFSKHQKIFSGKFFEMQPNTEKYFPFLEISISGKYVFSGKRFTATKHSLTVKRL